MSKKKEQIKDTQSRKYTMVINNPKEKDVTHEVIKNILENMKSLLYYCMSDEVGGKESTYHTHVFCAFKNPKAFSTMKNAFPTAHIENAKGSCAQNRDYVFKIGKFENTEKGATSIPGTQEEWGTMPDERNCPKPELAFLYERIKDGLTNAEIIEMYPEYIFDLTHMDRIRFTILQELFKNQWRNLEVFYIFGPTGTGKTRFVMENYGYQNVFRVTDYLHPFDGYKGQETILFEEFSSSLKIQEMLNYLDGYPLELPSRYSNKYACYTKVYITTNVPPELQYPNVKEESMSVWQAFWRRIKHIYWFRKNGVIKYDGFEQYANRDRQTGYPNVPVEFDDLLTSTEK